jgi:hypothetical protein
VTPYIQGLIASSAQKYGLDPALLSRLASTESGGDPNARSPAGAMGVMQLMPGTARDLGVNPNDPAQNVDGGAHYLKQQLDRFGSPELALAAYNAGPGRVARAGGVPNIPETQAYVGKVMGRGGNVSSGEGRSTMAGGSGADIFGMGSAPASQQGGSGADIFADAGSAPKSSGGGMDMGAPAPSIGDMRAFADPVYAKARAAEIARASQPRGPTAGLGDWDTQVVRNLGVNDELNGAAAYGVQGIKNLIRRAQGRAIDMPAATAGQAAMDADREAGAQYAQAHPNLNTAATIAGIAASGRPTGAPVAMGPLQAGATSAALQAPFALARQQGSLPERLPGAAADTALAFGTGAGLQAAGNALSRSSARAAARPLSDARTLANQGVTLTPGDMMGGLVKRAEDASTSIPMVGDAIRSAKIRGLESMNRSGYDEALGQIGETLPPNLNVGRDAVAYTHGRVSDAYTRALAPVVVAPDTTFRGDLVSNGMAASRLSRQAQDAYNGVVNDLTTRFSGPVSGEDFKAIDADLGLAHRAAQAGAGTQPGYGQLARVLGDLRTSFNDTLARSNPAAAAGKDRADAAHATLIRLRDASESLGARGGVFTAPQLQRAVRGADKGPWGFAEGRAMLQGLSDPASRVLPQTVPDSGTPFRSLMTTLGGLGGAVAGASVMGAAPIAAPAAVGIGGLMVGGSALYSRPVQAALNAVYRAASPGSARAALAQLAALAARDPAALPAYRQAAQQLGAQLPGGGGQQVPQQAPQAGTY